MKILIIISILLGISILFLLLCLGIVQYSRDYLDEANDENEDSATAGNKNIYKGNEAE